MGPFSLTPIGFVTDGQSFGNSPTASPYGVRLDTHAPVENVSVGGTTYAQREVTASARVDWRASRFTRAVLLDVGGQSDLLASMSAAAVLTDMETYATNRRAAGFDIVVTATVPPAGAAWYTGPQNVQRLALNALIRASSVFDAVADLALRPELQDPTDTAYFEADELHPNAGGAAVIAETFDVLLHAHGVS